MTDFSSIDIKELANNGGVVPFVGLLPVADFFEKIGLPQAIKQHLGVRGSKGYSDSEHVLALILMQLAGGDCVDHLNHCKKNVFGSELLKISIPSPTAARDWLYHFNNEEEDQHRAQGKAFIPQPNDHLAGFSEVHFHIWRQACSFKPLEAITLDQDATFINSEARGTLFNYKGERSYEAFNTYCPEYDLIVGTEFRDGNVPPGYRQFEELKRILRNVPEGIKKVSLRSDSAGYNIDLLKYCAKGTDERFGVIDFAISCPVGKELREAAHKVQEQEWQPVYRKTPQGLVATGQEWAEVAYVPNSLGSSKKGPEYRFLVTREQFETSADVQAKLHSEEVQMKLPGMSIEEMEEKNGGLKKLHLTVMKGSVYKIFALVTNMMERDGGDVILWHRGRCGKSEEVHHLLKDELAGGHVISKNFGANAAYWNIAVLALSMHNLFKAQLLPKGYSQMRPKTLRFLFYGIAGRVVTHARKVILKLGGVYGPLLREVQERLRALSVSTG